MNKSNNRSPFAIVGRLIVLVKPMLPVMLAAIVMGVAGHFCATFITIFGGFGILRALGLASPLKTVGTAFACILVFAAFCVTQSRRPITISPSSCWP